MPIRPVLALLLVTTACKKPVTPGASEPQAATATDPATQSEALDAFFERVHEERMEHDPVWAAYLGHPHDETQWTPFGEDAWTAQRDREQQWLNELDAMLDGEVSNDALSDEDQLNIVLFRALMQEELDDHRWRHHEYALTPLSGMHTWVPTFLMNVHRIQDRQDAENWIARVRNAAPLFDDVTTELALQAEMGITPPDWAYPQMIESMDNLMDGEPFEDGEPSVLLAHFDRSLAELDADDLDDETRSALREQAVTALRDDFGPAYTRMQEQLASDAKTVDRSAGAWALPDGAAYYAWQLQKTTTTELTAAEIHQLGLDEVARIQDEMRALMPQLGVEGDLQDLYTHLRESPDYTLSDDEAGRTAYLERARGFVTGMEAVLPEYFEHLPAQPLTVKRVEEWREASAGKAFYQPPSPDGERPGIFYANLAHMEDMPIYQLEALVYHEGVPGHHMQNAVSQTLDDLPPFRRFGHYTAYGEGWGLYSEFLPKELGFYEDPASDVGRLAMELWRACRLVVDTGLHDQQWTREQAIEYLVTETPNPRGDAVKAIERYMVWPGQATAYKVGMLEILRLREEARNALGDDFDLRGFHGVVLGTGPVPLDVLEDQVQAWVASKSEQ